MRHHPIDRRSELQLIQIGLRTFQSDLLPIPLQFQNAKRRRLGFIVEFVRFLQALHLRQ